MRTLSLLAVMLVVGARGAPQERRKGDVGSLLETSDNYRDPRLFFQFITVRPEECATDSTANPIGTCYTPNQCTNLGGTGSGNCAGGLGTCCYFTRTCGEKTYGNGTTFVNPSYDDTDTVISDCWLEVELLSDNICQLRLYLDTFELAQPTVDGECETDFMKITGTANDNTVPTLCGTNSGKHMYVDLDPTGGNPKIKIDTGATSTEAREWKINVDQIACDSQYKAPEGCTQYYTDSSGVVESFNYATPTADDIADSDTNLHLNNLRYGVCVASRSGYCSITWSNNDNEGTNPYTFFMSNDGTAIAPELLGTLDVSAQGAEFCPTDYVVIPGGEFVNPDDLDTPSQADRFCGLFFPNQVTSSIQPFVMYVITDEGEVTQGDNVNVGFSLQYRQNVC